MRRAYVSFLLALLSLVPLCSSYGADAPAIGAAAPDFHLTDATGKDTALSQFKGKTVVLEWYNPNCPFVKKFYSDGHMQEFQKAARAKGAVWLTINSNAEGKPGFIPQSDAATSAAKMGLEPNFLLLDPKGSAGRMYGARTTPHIFVIDGQGALRYAGAIDSEASTDSGDIAGATNYALGAVDALAQGKPVSPSSTEPYGCSVKY